MAGFVDAVEASLLDHYFGKATLTAPANLFVALSTTTPTDAAGNFTEPVGNGYARVSTAPADWNAASGTAPTVIDNASVITFPEATGSWGTVTHFGLFTASTGGTPVVWGALRTSRAVDSGQTPRFAAGECDVFLGDPSDTYA